ncbi:unnamed protein product [Amoebophrya sp. A25]|nr:unnamed protein product [Amoebophrya sp. A25]|eukprot:GSA25T00017493001.1
MKYSKQRAFSLTQLIATTQERRWCFTENVPSSYLLTTNQRITSALARRPIDRVGILI